MKTKIIAILLFGMTTAAVVFYPAQSAIKPPAQVVGHLVDPVTSNQRPKIEVVFVLDTTGSMGGLLAAAKEKIWSIATTMAGAQPAPEISMGLVAFRDRGDAYVTRIVDLSGDLDTLYGKLMDLDANGGGDGPESVNQALSDAVHRISWSGDPDSYKVVFLVGDAPAHMDYQDDVKYPETIRQAAQMGIVVNTIQCGQAGNTAAMWQQIAQLAEGTSVQVDQNGSALAIATPYDKTIAALAKQMDDTRVYFGTSEEKLAQEARLEATDKLEKFASDAVKARRGAFNTTVSGTTNFLGQGELVDMVASGETELSSIDEDQLPQEMQAMAPAAREAYVEAKASSRLELQERIKDATGERDEYLKKKVGELESADKSLDHQLFDTIRKQAAKRGITYKEDATRY
jgi:Mg-chelatase subunit ChlD